MKWVMTLLSLSLLAGGAVAADGGEMKMHRKQAGEPDKSGWMLAALSVTPRQVGPLRAVDLVFKGPTAVRYQRVVLLDSDLLMLSVESPAEHSAAVQELASRFFDSLQVDAKPE